MAGKKKKVLTHAEMVSKGGKARAKKLSKERREQIARAGGVAKAKKRGRK